jgi:hypothetical protein
MFGTDGAALAVPNQGDAMVPSHPVALATFLYERSDNSAFHLELSPPSDVV